MNFIQYTTDEQIKKVVHLAKEIWEDHFTPIIGAGQVAYMLDKFQSQEALTKQIYEENCHYYALEEDDRLIAYCAVRDDGDAVYLSKLYVKKDYRGRGLSRRILTETLKACGYHPPVKLWLNVNKENTSSIEIYKKLGFSITGSSVNDIGGGYVMDDYILEGNINF